MDVISALFYTLSRTDLAELHDRVFRRDVEAEELKDGLAEIMAGDYPEEVKEVVLPNLAALRELMLLGVTHFGRTR